MSAREAVETLVRAIDRAIEQGEVGTVTYRGMTFRVRPPMPQDLAQYPRFTWSEVVAASAAFFNRTRLSGALVRRANRWAAVEFKAE